MLFVSCCSFSCQTNMISIEEKIDLLKSSDVGFKSPNDKLFKSTNKNLLTKYKKLGIISEEELITKPTKETEIFCTVFSCNKTFDNVVDYQAHYKSNHRYVCSQCRSNFPTAHLLDLHLSEKHDSYFAARVARGDAVFACYLQECNMKLLSAKERKEHCLKVHNFPCNYRFAQFDGNCANNIKQNEKMDIDVRKEDIQTSSRFKNFTFGQQREKTFETTHKTQNPKERSVEMNELKEALFDI